jgi:plasmid stabilization system protein ParE
VKIVFHPRVVGEIDSIMRYYESVAGPQLADDFYGEFRFYVQRASEAPESFSERTGDYRRANLKRFPYNFLFRVQEDHIRVLVVRHHRRQPDFGTGRK